MAAAPAHAKCLFVLGETFPGVKTGPFYSFRPHNFGPFDAAVYRDAEDLASRGWIEVVSLKNGHMAYRATPAGVARAQDLMRRLPSETLFLSDVRSWANRVSLSDLLKAIYEKWPDYRAPSVFVA